MIRFILIIFGAIFLYLIRDILLMIFAALILAIALDRPIDRLEKLRLPRALGTILIYLLLFLTFVLALYLIVPPLALQIKSLAVHYSGYLEKISYGPEFLNLKEILKGLADQLATGAGAQTILASISGIFGNLLTFLIIVVIAMFLNIQEKGVKRSIFYFIPARVDSQAVVLFDRIQKKVGGWLWGRILSCIFVGILIFLGLLILGIDYALTLGILAALLNIIPFVGPVIAAVPAIFFALLKSPFLALAVALLYFIVNSFLESFVLSPIVMQKVIHLNPAVIILAALVGAKLGGLLGLILGIPTAAIISIFLQEYMRIRK